MKATKKPKRPNPFRSNLGLVNVYPPTTKAMRQGLEPIPAPTGWKVRINSSGQQHSPAPASLPNMRGWR